MKHDDNPQDQTPTWQMLDELSQYAPDAQATDRALDKTRQTLQSHSHVDDIHRRNAHRWPF